MIAFPSCMPFWIVVNEHLIGMATCTPDTPARAMVLIFIGSAFIGFNEIGCSTVATVALDDQREIGAATGIASSLRSAVSTLCST